MAIQAKLQFGDNATGMYNRTYNVVNYRNRVARAYNAFNPQSLVKCTDVEVTIVAPSKKDLSIYDWYVNNGMMSGRLVFDILDVFNSERTIKRYVTFENAQCISLKDTYDINENRQRLIKIVFTPAHVTIDDVTFARTESHITTNESHNDDMDMDMDEYNNQYDF